MSGNVPNPGPRLRPVLGLHVPSGPDVAPLARGAPASGARRIIRKGKKEAAPAGVKEPSAPQAPPASTRGSTRSRACQRGLSSSSARARAVAPSCGDAAPPGRAGCLPAATPARAAPARAEAVPRLVARPPPSPTCPAAPAPGAGSDRHATWPRPTAATQSSLWQRPCAPKAAFASCDRPPTQPGSVQIPSWGFSGPGPQLQAPRPSPGWHLTPRSLFPTLGTPRPSPGPTSVPPSCRGSPSPAISCSASLQRGRKWPRVPMAVPRAGRTGPRPRRGGSWPVLTPTTSQPPAPL